MDRNGKLIPFGEISESFKGLKDEGIYYVDKTSFIPFLIEQRRQICVFTRPRRFGKTLMLRTLQTFFEYVLDEEGRPVDNRHYFEGLKVMEAGEDVLRHLGQYPVISLSFKDVSGDSYEEIVAQLRGAVCVACEPHKKILKQSGLLSEAQLETLQHYLDRRASESELMQFFEILTGWINSVTGRNSVILLDEYDVPLQKAAIYDNKHPGSDLFDKTVKLIGKFISAGFKSNNNLAFGVISGCMRVARESIFTGMNNPGVITVLSKIPDEFWGFTEAEVKSMLAYYGIEDKYPMIERWYDGYAYSGRKVFNPWSLLNAIRGLVNDEGEFAIKPYWGLTSGNDIIDDMIDRNPDHRNALAKLMNGETMCVPVYENLSYRDLRENPDAVWSFLFYTGYLKTVKLSKNEDDMLEAEIAVPNTEVKTLMRTSLTRWWKNSNLTSSNAEKLLSAFWDGNIRNIENILFEILNTGISVHDAKEDFYHGMVVGLLWTKCRVQSNREHGEGRPDIVAIEGNRAVILELKCVPPSVMQKIPQGQAYVQVPGIMKKLLDEAETQIKTRHYVEGLLFEEQNVTEVKAFGVCFCRKRCMAREVPLAY